jgi:hypothetical protein
MKDEGIRYGNILNRRGIRKIKDSGWKTRNSGEKLNK